MAFRSHLSDQEKLEHSLSHMSERISSLSANLENLNKVASDLKGMTARVVAGFLLMVGLNRQFSSGLYRLFGGAPNKIFGAMSGSGGTPGSRSAAAIGSSTVGENDFHQKLVNEMLERHVLKKQLQQDAHNDRMKKLEEENNKWKAQQKENFDLSNQRKVLTEAAKKEKGALLAGLDSKDPDKTFKALQALRQALQSPESASDMFKELFDRKIAGIDEVAGTGNVAGVPPSMRPGLGAYLRGDKATGLDIETFDKEGDKSNIIWQVGATDLTGGKLGSGFSSLVKPSDEQLSTLTKKDWQDAAERSGFKDDPDNPGSAGEKLKSLILTQGIPLVEAIAKLQEMVNGAVLIGHNSNKFDLPRLKAAGLEVPSDQETLDTLKLAQQGDLPGLKAPNNELKTLFGLTGKGNKDALEAQFGRDAEHQVGPDIAKVHYILQYLFKGLMKVADDVYDVTLADVVPDDVPLSGLGSEGVGPLRPVIPGVTNEESTFVPMDSKEGRQLLQEAKNQARKEDEEEFQKRKASAAAGKPYRKGESPPGESEPAAPSKFLGAFKNVWQSVKASGMGAVRGFTGKDPATEEESKSKLFHGMKKFGEKLSTFFLAGSSMGGSLLSAASPDAMGLIQGSFKLLAATIGRSLIPAAVWLAIKIQEVAQWFASVSPETKKLIGTIAAVVLGIAGAVLAFKMILSPILLVGAALTTLLPLIVAAGLAFAAFQTVKGVLTGETNAHKEMKDRKAAQEKALGWDHQAFKDDDFDSIMAIKDPKERQKKIGDKFSHYTSLYGQFAGQGIDLAKQSNSFKGVGQQVMKNIPLVKNVIDATGKKTFQEQSTEAYNMASHYRKHAEAYKLALQQGRKLYYRDPETKKEVEIDEEKKQEIIEKSTTWKDSSGKNKGRIYGRDFYQKKDVAGIQDANKKTPEQQAKLSSFLMSITSTKANPQYSSVEDTYKRVQLEAIGKDPLQLEIEKINREGLKDILKELEAANLLHGEQLKVAKALTFTGN